jgi:multicomponent Na+:H+ antiporter subunit D
MSWAPVLPVLTPLAAALLVFLVGRTHARAVALGAAATIVVVVAWCVIAVATEGVLRTPLGSWGVPLGIELRLDGLAALVLATIAVVSGIATVAAAADVPTRAAPEAFWAAWFMLWCALNALIVAGDIFNMYVTLELLTLAAVALVASNGATARRAALSYLLWALAGSLAYLSGVALLYARYGAVDLLQVSAVAMDDTPTRVAAALMTVGLALKAALVPLHRWLPPAHASAPPAVSAVLSALVVMAPFVALLRLWTTVFVALPRQPIGLALALLGAIAVVWGAFRALQQVRLKLLIAYSTVAQIGYLFLGFAIPGAEQAVVYLAISHAAAKAALFLAAGIIVQALGHDRIDDLGEVSSRLPITLFTMGVAGISLMGLPPSGGFVGKWLLLNAAMAAGAWWLVAVTLAGGLIAGAYVYRVLASCFRDVPDEATAPISRTAELAALTLALVALALNFVAPWPLRLLAVGSGA